MLIVPVQKLYTHTFLMLLVRYQMLYLIVTPYCLDTLGLDTKQYLLRLTMTTQTNGVSFSLEAGACCVVLFNNTGSLNSGASISSLNINSTGAKSVSTFLSGSLLDTLYTRSSSIVLQKACSVIFDGSKYYVPITKYVYTYSDES